MGRLTQHPLGLKLFPLFLCADPFVLVDKGMKPCLRKLNSQRMKPRGDFCHGRRGSPSPCPWCSATGLPPTTPAALTHSPPPRCHSAAAPCPASACGEGSRWEYEIRLSQRQEDERVLGAGGVLGRCWSWSLQRMVRLKIGCSQPSPAFRHLNSLLSSWPAEEEAAMKDIISSTTLAVQVKMVFCS